MLYNSYQIFDCYAKLGSEIISTLSTIENIYQKNNELVNNFIKIRNISFNISKSASTYQNIVIQMSNVIILYADVMLITIKELTIGTVVIYMNIKSIVLASILKLVSVQLDIETFIVTYKRFVAILDNIEPDFNKVEENESLESITFCNGFKN